MCGVPAGAARYHHTALCLQRSRRNGFDAEDQTQSLCLPLTDGDRGRLMLELDGGSPPSLFSILASTHLR